MVRRWAYGEGEAFDEVEKTMSENFGGEFVDRTGLVYRRSELDRDVRKKPFGERSELRYHKRPIQRRPVALSYLVRILLLAACHLQGPVNLKVGGWDQSGTRIKA